MTTDLSRIAPFVSNLDRKVFALFGLPEEVIAVLFAYYSRSRDTLRTNLARLLADEELGLTVGVPSVQASRAQDKARAFHEKWVVGYGHASVAEHAIVHLALEDVSIVASKVIEDLRLGSFTEKSTRYVVFDTGSFAELPELPTELRDLYRTSCQNLFRTYLDLQPLVEGNVRELSPKRSDQTEAAWNAVVRSHTCDLLRGLLPAGTRTNLGLTANARALSLLLTKMLSWPLAEVQRLGTEMRNEALVVAPTLLRHAEASEHRCAMAGDIEESMAELAATPEEGIVHQAVHLARFDTDALERVALALTYASGPLADAQDRLRALQTQPKQKLHALVDAAMKHRGPHDPAPRAFEASTVTVELELDYGAYRDLQRHRMLTPLVRTLGCELGAEIPEDLDSFGYGDRVREALEEAKKAWTRIVSTHPLQAQYAVPLAYRVRALWTMNLREVFHVVELRSGRQGHASYRRVAQELFREVNTVHPWLGKHIRADLGSYPLARDSA